MANVRRAGSHRKARPPKLLAVAVATVIALVVATGSAYAAGFEPVTNAVNGVLSSVANVLGGGDLQNQLVI